MSQSRIQKSAKNIAFGCIGYLIGLIMAFISKSIFLSRLGENFNGLNGLFINILNILNIAELGFGSAIVFTMYEPLKNSNEIKISKLVNFMRSIYLLISISILVVGLIVLPFIQYLIKDPISSLDFTLDELRIFYFLFLINSVLGYSLVHKKTLIIADQNSYMVTNIDNGTTILLHIFQIVLLLTMKSESKFIIYLIFLIAPIIKTLLRNIIINSVANKKYKYLKKNKKQRLEKNDKITIFKKVRDMSVHKISEAILNGSTTVIISSFIGLSDTSTYSNYMLIVINLIVVINIFYSSILASVGNLCVSSSISRQLKIFNKINYLTKFLSFFIFTCLYALVNEFMKLWIKNKDISPTFSNDVVFAICIYAYLTIYRKTTITFRDAKGLFTHDRYKAIFEIIIGLPLSIAFSIEFGVIGTVASYCFTMLVVSIPTENKVLFKSGFNASSKRYYFDSIANLLLAILTANGFLFIVNHIPVNGWEGFIVKLLITVIGACTIFITSTCYSSDFKYYINLFRKFVSLLQKRTSTKSNN